MVDDPIFELRKHGDRRGLSNNPEHAARIQVCEDIADLLFDVIKSRCEDTEDALSVAATLLLNIVLAIAKPEHAQELLRLTTDHIYAALAYAKEKGDGT